MADVKNQSYGRTVDTLNVPFTTFPKLLEKWATLKPESEAFVFYTFGKPKTSISFGKLYQDALKLAKGLRRLGINKGDIVAIAGFNTPEWLVSTYASQLVGARPLFFTLHDKKGENMTGIIKKVGGCKMIIFDPGQDDLHWKISQKFLTVDPSNGAVKKSDIPSVEWVLLMTPLESTEKCFTINDVAFEEDTSLPELDPADIAAILQTSGSTGFPKAVECSHYRLLQTAFHFTYLSEWNDPKKDGEFVFFNDRPFYWLGGFPCLSLATGGKHVTQTNTLVFTSIAEIVKFNSQIVQNEKIPYGLFVTPFLLELLMLEDFSWKFRSVITGGQPVPASCLSAIGKMYDTLGVLYGSSEAALNCGKTYHTSSERYVGMAALPGVEMKIVGNNGMIVPVGTKGELYIRNVTAAFRGYINEPEKTAAVISSSGWYKTDDFAHINSEGCVEIHGRVSDVLEIGGAKVLPSFIEEIIKKNPAVKEVVVFAVKDIKHADDIACAAVVLKNEATLTAESLTEFIKEELKFSEDAKFLQYIYVPKHILFLDNLPKTATGKNDRMKTREISLPHLKD